VMTAIGAARSIPGDAVVLVAAGTDAAGIADAVRPLLQDPFRRAELSRGALAHAARHTYALAARALYEELRSRPRLS
jgi:hypothetical protein